MSEPAGVFEGLKVLELAKDHQGEAETIIVTAHADVPTAKAALQGGAYDFIEKPLEERSLMASIEQGLAEARRRFEARRLAEEAAAGLASLTPRERDIVDRMIRGAIKLTTRTPRRV